MTSTQTLTFYMVFSALPSRFSDVPVVPKPQSRGGAGDSGPRREPFLLPPRLHGRQAAQKDYGTINHAVDVVVS